MVSTQGNTDEGGVVETWNATARWRHWSQDYPNIVSLVTTFGLLIAIVLIFFSINQRFVSPHNLVIILNQSAPFIILGVGMTLVITSRGIDLSVGAMVAAIGTVVGLALISMKLPVAVAVVAAIICGAACGAFNGFCIARFRIPPLIVTLATMALFRGLAFVTLGHNVLFGFPDDFLWLARGRILGVAPSLYLAVLVSVFGYVLLHHTRFGQHISAVGGNEEAARLSGINVNRVKFLLYTLCGTLTALATIVWIARLNSVQAAVAYGVELHVIALVVLGGTSLFGGRGLIVGSVLGALTLAALENGLVLAGFTSFVQDVLLGLLFITVVAIRTIQGRDGQVNG